MNGRIGREEDRTNVRTAADNITDLLDEQALKNFEMNLQVNRYKSELRHALQQLDEHTYCPGDVDIQCKEDKCKGCKEAPTPKAIETVDYNKCSKVGVLKKNKKAIILAVLWVIIVILAVGWSPTGNTAEAINNSWVELIVNFFKMVLFAIAGIATYILVKKDNE